MFSVEIVDVNDDAEDDWQGSKHEDCCVVLSITIAEQPPWSENEETTAERLFMPEAEPNWDFNWPAQLNEAELDDGLVHLASFTAGSLPPGVDALQKDADTWQTFLL